MPAAGAALKSPAPLAAAESSELKPRSIRDRDCKRNGSSSSSSKRRQEPKKTGDTEPVEADVDNSQMPLTESEAHAQCKAQAPKRGGQRPSVAASHIKAGHVRPKVRDFAVTSFFPVVYENFKHQQVSIFSKGKGHASPSPDPLQLSSMPAAGAALKSPAPLAAAESSEPKPRSDRDRDRKRNGSSKRRQDPKNADYTEPVDAAGNNSQMLLAEKSEAQRKDQARKRVRRDDDETFKMKLRQRKRRDEDDEKKEEHGDASKSVTSSSIFNPTPDARHIKGGHVQPKKPKVRDFAVPSFFPLFMKNLNTSRIPSTSKEKVMLLPHLFPPDPHRTKNCYIPSRSPNLVLQVVKAGIRFASTIRDEPYAPFVGVIRYASTTVKGHIVKIADPRVASLFAVTADNAVGVFNVKVSVFVSTTGTSTDALFARSAFSKCAALTTFHQSVFIFIPDILW